LCSSDSFLFNGLCTNVKDVCGSDAKLYKGTCIRKTSQMVDICNIMENYVFDSVTNTCLCKEGFVGILAMNNSIICSKCPENSAYNP
jgi:hypothetical protein